MTIFSTFNLFIILFLFCLYEAYNFIDYRDKEDIIKNFPKRWRIKKKPDVSGEYIYYLQFKISLLQYKTTDTFSSQKEAEDKLSSLFNKSKEYRSLGKACVLKEFKVKKEKPAEMLNSNLLCSKEDLEDPNYNPLKLLQ